MKRILLQNSSLQDVAEESALVLTNGGLIVAPFDTVYGIITNPKDEVAVRNIDNIKGRPESKTIGLATFDIEVIAKLVDLSEENEKFIKEKIPGKYTFILKEQGRNDISDLCKRNGNLAIRVPDSQLILRIAELSGGILAQTSANRSGEANCYSVDDISKQFKGLDLFDLVIDGGRLDESQPSELWDLTGISPKKIERS